MWEASSRISITTGRVLTAADYIARWDGADWSALGSDGAGEGSINDPVNTLAVSGPYLYAGGGFDNVNNNGTVLTAADVIVRWDGANWSALGEGTAGDGALSCGVWDIAVNGPDVYAGGCFQNINNYGTDLDNADYIAKWDGSNWSALGSDGANNGSIKNVVGAVAVINSYVFIGGRFLDVNDNGTILTAADNIAWWDGAHWLPLNNNGAGEGSLNKSVYDMAISGSSLYAGGEFIDVNNGGTILPEADYLAVYSIPPQSIYLPLVER